MGSFEVIGINVVAPPLNGRYGPTTTECAMTINMHDVHHNVE